MDASALLLPSLLVACGHRVPPSVAAEEREILLSFAWADAQGLDRTCIQEDTRAMGGTSTLKWIDTVRLASVEGGYEVRYEGGVLADLQTEDPILRQVMERLRDLPAPALRVDRAGKVQDVVGLEPYRDVLRGFVGDRELPPGLLEALEATVLEGLRQALVQEWASIVGMWAGETLAVGYEYTLPESVSGPGWTMTVGASEYLPCEEGAPDDACVRLVTVLTSELLPVEALARGPYADTLGAVLSSMPGGQALAGRVSVQIELASITDAEPSTLLPHHTILMRRVITRAAGLEGAEARHRTECTWVARAP